MIDGARVLIGDCLDPHKNLALEEALLLSPAESRATLFLWQNKNTVVVGAGQNAWRECRPEAMSEDGVTLARRSSGGGAVYHDLGNLNFSFIVPRADYDVARQLGVVLEAVKALGFEAEKSGRNDLTLNGRKFSGNAFRLTRDMALHHGTLLLSSDMNKIGKYLNVDPAKLAAKGVKSVPARVVNLGAGLDEARGALASAFSAEYGAAEATDAYESLPAGYAELLKKHESWQWLWGASPEGDELRETRLSFGCVQLAFTVRRGIAERAVCHTDSMDETLAERLSLALSGARFSAADLAARAEAAGAGEVAAWLAGMGF